MGFVRGCLNPAFLYRGGGGLMMILFWGILIIAAVYLFKNLNKDKYSERGYVDRGKGNNKSEVTSQSELSPEEIARRRYAKGEIDREEFNKIKNELKK